MKRLRPHFKFLRSARGPTIVAIPCGILYSAKKTEEFPWRLIFPGAMFSLTVFSLNFLGDGPDVRSSKD